MTSIVLNSFLVFQPDPPGYCDRDFSVSHCWSYVPFFHVFP